MFVLSLSVFTRGKTATFMSFVHEKEVNKKELLAVRAENICSQYLYFLRPAGCKCAYDSGYLRAACLSGTKPECCQVFPPCPVFRVWKCVVSEEACSQNRHPSVSSLETEGVFARFWLRVAIFLGLTQRGNDRPTKTNVVTSYVWEQWQELIYYCLSSFFPYAVMQPLGQTHTHTHT